jgi:hypothetical protein
MLRAADRSSGTPAVLAGRYVASADHTGLLRRPASEVLCDHTARAHAATAQRPSSATASVSACAASCFVARGVRASREEKTASPIPAESHVAVCMPAASEKRGHLAAAPGSLQAGKQSTKRGGCREGPLASDIGSFSQHRRRAAQTPAWSTRLHDS